MEPDQGGTGGLIIAVAWIRQSAARDALTCKKERPPVASRPTA